MTHFMSGPSDEQRDQEDELNRKEEPTPSRTYSDEAEEGAPQPAEDEAQVTNSDPASEEEEDEDEDEEEGEDGVDKV